MKLPKFRSKMYIVTLHQVVGKGKNRKQQNDRFDVPRKDLLKGAALQPAKVKKGKEWAITIRKASKDDAKASNGSGDK